jgi:MtrB/PioB family decaheme-associated outer membrane protein
MRQRREVGVRSGASWLRALVGLVIAAALLPAQEPGLGHGTLYLGVRRITGEHGSSKFTEYRQVPNGFFLQGAELHQERLFGRNLFFNFQTRDTVQDNQSHMLNLEAPGKLRFDFVWAQTPHDFSNASRSFFVAAGPGVFTVPPAIRTALQSRPADLPQFLNQAGAVQTTLQRERGTGTFTLTPTDAWTLRLQYSRDRQDGARPFGTTTNGFSNSIELPEPINYRTHEIRAGAEYARQNWGVQFGYQGSLFENRIGELVWDNPFRTTDAAGGGSRGRIDLYPDNQAQSFNVAGAWNLGASTRLMASVVPGWMRQNDAFLPFTINSAVTGAPNLPAQSLDASKQTLAMNYTVTNTALAHWTWTARYRSYDYNNNTSSLVFPRYVSTDSSLGSLARQSLPYGYARKTAGLEASWLLGSNQFLKFGYEFERMSRERRDVEIANEHSAGISFDSSPRKWLTLRTSYRRSERSPRHYEANEESFPFGEGTFGMGQLEGLRKFDEAGRARDHAEVLLQLDPSQAWSFSIFGGTNQDRYRDSAYGLLKDINVNMGVDLSYSPRPEWSLFAEYSRETQRYSLRSRQRNPPSATAAANDSARNDWITDLRDLTDTWVGGVNSSLFRNRVTAEGFYSVSAAKGVTHTLALGATGTGFLVTSAADYPNTSARFQQVVGAVRVRLSQNVYPRFEYRLEKYGRADYQIERISPYMVPVDSSTGASVFLGAQVPGFKAHVFSFVLEYRF